LREGGDTRNREHGSDKAAAAAADARTPTATEARSTRTRSSNIGGQRRIRRSADGQQRIRSTAAAAARSFNSGGGGGALTLGIHSGACALNHNSFVERRRRHLQPGHIH